MNNIIKIILLSGLVGMAVGLKAQVVENTKIAETGAVVRVEPGQTKSPYGYVLKMNLEGQTKVPLLISLHGAGGGKNGVKGMGLGEESTLSEKKYSYVLVKPVCPGRWTAEKLDRMIESLKKDYAAVIDTNRIYIYGHSMGGYGSWLYCIFHGDKIAAMMSSEGGFIQGTGPISQFDFKHFKTLPVWVFQNTGDKTVPFKYAKELVDAAKAAGGNPKFTVFEMDGHKSHMPEMMQKETLDWLFSQSLEKRKP